jgi:hypothetical protein
MTEAFNPGPDEQELIRWGDKQTLILPVGELPLTTLSQLVKVHRRIPESWRVTIWANIILPQPVIGPTYDLTIFFDLIVGAGSAQLNLQPQIRLFAAAPAVVLDYNSLTTPKQVGFMLFDLPANDIQIAVAGGPNFSPFNNAGAIANVEVGALASPRYTPPTPGPSGGPPPDKGHPWIESPFWPEPTHYR